MDKLQLSCLDIIILGFVELWVSYFRNPLRASYEADDFTLTSVDSFQISTRLSLRNFGRMRLAWLAIAFFSDFAELEPSREMLLAYAAKFLFRLYRIG